MRCKWDTTQDGPHAWHIKNTSLHGSFFGICNFCILIGVVVFRCLNWSYSLHGFCTPTKPLYHMFKPSSTIHFFVFASTIQQKNTGCLHRPSQKCQAASTTHHKNDRLPPPPISKMTGCLHHPPQKQQAASWKCPCNIRHRTEFEQMLIHITTHTKNNILPITSNVYNKPTRTLHCRWISCCQIWGRVLGACNKNGQIEMWMNCVHIVRPAAVRATMSDIHQVVGMFGLADIWCHSRFLNGAAF